MKMSPKIPKNNINMYTLCLLEKGNGGGYKTHYAKNQSLTNVFKMMIFQKDSYQFDGTITMHF
jgi:hypothetical protein